MGQYAKYAKKAKKLSAKATRVIPAKSIVTAGWVRFKCRFGCDGYGQTLTCPPYSPSPEETKDLIADYKYALLIRGDEHVSISNIVAVLEKELFLDGYYKAVGMGAGPCQLCVKCPRSCRHPEKARPSMEACGIDVYSTVRANGFPIEVLKGPSCKGNYYGIVLIE